MINNNITGYKIESSFDGTNWFTMVENTGTKYTSNYPHYNQPPYASYTIYPIKNLTSATQYYFRVYAMNAVGIGPVSDIVSVTTWRTPNAPTNLSASNVLARQLTLSWTPPIISPDPPSTPLLNGYKIEYSTNSDWSSSISNTTNSTNTNYTVNNLIPNTTYYFTVSGINPFGVGTPSSSISAKTLS
jgi:hypothetical protein